MLLMERTGRQVIVAENKAALPKLEVQMELLEKTPLEEAWENVLEIMCKHISRAECKSWLEVLHLGELKDGILHLQAPTKFIADYVENHYKHKVVGAWESIGQPVNSISLFAKGKKAA